MLLQLHPVAAVASTPCCCIKVPVASISYSIEHIALASCCGDAVDVTACARRRANVLPAFFGILTR
jgi:hypothetical protein